MEHFYYSNFQNNPWGNGAEKRTSQIIYLINSCFGPSQNLDIELVPFYRIERKAFGRAYRYCKKTRKKLVSRNFLHALASMKGLNKKLVDNLPDLIFWEYSRCSNNAIPFIATELNVPVVAFPHNLESLVPGQRSFSSGKNAPDWLDEEIAILKQCDIIFTISHEEAWLLNLYGLNAYYLPYYPVRQVEEYCLNIKEKRNKTNQDNFIFIVGTVGNSPTYEAFRELLNFWESNWKDLPPLKVGGYKTEILRNEFFSETKNYTILGSLSKEQLEENLVKCSRVLVYQKPSTGALTKIPELLLSEIPIVGNYSSFRSYHSFDGVSIFNDLEDLISIFSEPSFNPIASEVKGNSLYMSIFEKIINRLI